MLNIYVGYDEREAIAYHNFCNSIIRHSTQPLSFTPLALNNVKAYTETHTDGSNAFIYSRFLVPHLQGYKGWALFADGDMICNADISELFEYADDTKAVCVVKHNYTTKYPKKYLGNMNCIGCAARHCLMAFIPDHIKKWDYVKQVAEKYKFDARTLAEKVKQMKGL